MNKTNSLKQLKIFIVPILIVILVIGCADSQLAPSTSGELSEEAEALREQIMANNGTAAESEGDNGQPAAEPVTNQSEDTNELGVLAEEQEVAPNATIKFVQPQPAEIRPTPLPRFGLEKVYDIDNVSNTSCNNLCRNTNYRGDFKTGEKSCIQWWQDGEPTGMITVKVIDEKNGRLVTSQQVAGIARSHCQGAEITIDTAGKYRAEVSSPTITHSSLPWEVK